MPETRDWWAGLYDDFLATGIDGVWNDMNEPAVFDGPDGTMPIDALHRGGGDLPPGPHLRYHNVYGMLMVRASYEGILAARPEKRPFVLSRANFLGGHRYAATWTGDNRSTWEHLKMSVPMSLNLGLSGQPFNGPDIGGFTGVPDPVLYGHWIALGAFYPFSRAHADNHSPGNEPWMFSPYIEKVAQTALFRRYRLLPYIYTVTEEASRTGMPVMRPLFFADPKDLDLRDEEEAFLLGKDLLVLPLWAKSPDLPEGNWREIQLLPGDRESDAYQPVLRIRPGAIVPLGPVVQSTDDYALDPLTLLVSLDENGRAEGTLYEDGWDGFAYKDGAYSRSYFFAQQAGDSVTVGLLSREGALPDTPRQVLVRVVTDSGVFSGSGNPDTGISIPVSAQ
jgi:alpha-glucosidase